MGFHKKLIQRGELGEKSEEMNIGVEAVRVTKTYKNP